MAQLESECNPQLFGDCFLGCGCILNGSSQFEVLCGHKLYFELGGDGYNWYTQVCFIHLMLVGEMANWFVLVHSLHIPLWFLLLISATSRQMAFIGALKFRSRMSMLRYKTRRITIEFVEWTCNDGLIFIAFEELSFMPVILTAMTAMRSGTGKNCTAIGLDMMYMKRRGMEGIYGNIRKFDSRAKQIHWSVFQIYGQMIKSFKKGFLVCFKSQFVNVLLFLACLFLFGTLSCYS